MTLRDLRNSRGLKRNFVSQNLGISGKHLNDIESGKVNLTSNVASKLSEFYKISLDDIWKLYKHAAVEKKQKDIIKKIENLSFKKNIKN